MSDAFMEEKCHVTMAVCVDCYEKSDYLYLITLGVESHIPDSSSCQAPHQPGMSPPPHPALNSLFQNSRISAFFSVSPFRSYACSNLTSASVNPTRFNASGSDALVTVGA